MAHSQLLLGKTAFEQQIELAHDFGNELLPVDGVQLLDPLLPSVLKQLINVARFIPPSLRASTRDLSPANAFNLPLANLLND